MSKVLNLFVVLFLFSCGDVGDRVTKQKDDPLANKFQPIEGNLQEFANRHYAQMATVWSKVQKYNPDGSDSFLVKRIVWNDGRFGKAVVIQQHNDVKGVDTTTWDFLNIAWLQDTVSTAKPTLVKSILAKVDFQTIEKDIEHLLNESEKVLSGIKVEDLK